MPLGLINKTNNTWIYIGKVCVTAVLFYSTANLASNLNFSDMHNQEGSTLIWPPSGIALGLMMVWGRSIWPGILIASIFRISGIHWVNSNHVELVNTLLLTFTYTISRIIEPLTGHYVLKKLGIIERPFKTAKNTVYFILSGLSVAIISSAISAIALNLVKNDPNNSIFSQTFDWYIENVIGILIFTPFIYAIYHETKRKSHLPLSTLLIITLFTLLFSEWVYFLKLSNSSLHIIIENAMPYLIIPILLWIAFRFSLLITTYTIFLFSITSIYYTYLGHGPFVTNGDMFQFTVWLLQTFLFVISVATLASYAISNEIIENIKLRSIQNGELLHSQQIILQTMEDLSKERNKALESDRLKSSFLANMSHEIRTPMNAIMGISELLERFEMTDEKRMELTHLIKDQSENLLNVINNILLISQLEVNQSKPRWIRTDLNDLFKELREQFIVKAKSGKNKDIDIISTISLPGNDTIILADEANLKIVLTHLLDNAIKFTEQGHIEFSCLQKDSSTLLFQVSDTGIGISANKFNLIFQPFRHGDETTHLKHGGTGLGLAISKMLVAKWNGEIWLESSHGQGSVFSFTMPYKKEFALGDK